MIRLLRWMVLALVLMTGHGMAQCATCSDGKVKVGFHAVLCAEDPVQFEFKLADTGAVVAAYSVDGGGCGGYARIANLSTQLKPEVKYKFKVKGTKVRSAHCSFSIQGCYVLFMDQGQANGFDFDRYFEDPPPSAPDYGCLPYEREWEIVIKSKSGGPGSADSGESSSAGPAGGVSLQIALGGLSNGLTAGNLGFASGAIDPSTMFTPAGLNYESVSADVEVIRSAGVIRQIKAPEVLADVTVAGASSYYIKLYPLSRVGTMSGGVYSIINPTVAAPDFWKIEGISGLPDPQLKITETHGAISFEKTFSYSSGSKTYLMVNGTESESRVETALAGGIRQFDLTRLNAGVTAEKTRSLYKTFPWGEELISFVKDFGTGGANLTTQWTYYEDPADAPNYGRLKWVINADGSWVKYDYYGTDSNLVGQIRNEYRPWKDSPTLPSGITMDPYGITETNCRKIVYTYNGFGGVTNSDVGDVQEYVPNDSLSGLIQVRFSSVSYYYTTHYVNVNGVYFDLPAKGTSNASGETDIFDYTTDIPVGLRGRTACSRDKDGRERIVNSFEDGNYDNATGVFTQVGGGKFKRIQTQFNDNTFMVEVMDSSGLVWKEEKKYQDGTVLSLRKNSYDANGNLTSTTLNGNTVYSALWTDGRLAWESDETGITTTYNLYDAYGRVKQQTRNGVVTNFSYDAAGRLLSTSRTAGGLTLTSSHTYDSAGRVKTETSEGGQTITIDYPDPRITTRTHPDGSMELTTTYLDGQVKSRTRKSSPADLTTVGTYFDYGADSDGLRTKEMRGSASSTVFTQTWSNKDGNVEISAQNGPGGLIIEELKYDYSNPNRIISRTVPGEADIMFHHELTSTGEITRTGRDMDGDEYFYTNSADQVDETETRYVVDSGIYYQETIRRRYEKDVGILDAATVLSRTRTQLTGLPAGVSSVVQQFDAGNNLTTITTSINRATRTVTTTTDVPDSNLNAVEIHIDGLLRSAATPTVAAATTYFYDPLERLTTVTSPHLVSTVTVYNPATGRVSSVTQGVAMTSYEYYPNNSGQPGSGQVSAETRPDTTVLRTSYTAFGEVFRQWGGSSYPMERSYDDLGNPKTLKTYRAGTGWNGTTWPASPGTADTTTWEYYGWGPLWKKTDASSANPVIYEYNSSGKLWRVKRPRGIPGGGAATYAVTTYSWNNLGLPSGISYSDGTPSVTYSSYDRVGRPRTMTDAAGLHTFAYPDFQHVTETISGSGFLSGNTRTMTLDSYGRLADTTVTSGIATHSVGYQYKPDSRLDIVTAGIASATYTYAPDSDFIKITTFKSSGTTRLTSTRSYDSLDRLAGVSHAYGGKIQSFGVTEFDSMNRRKKIEREDNTRWAYDYNSKGEVLGGWRQQTAAPNTAVPGWSFAYSFDEIGNRTSSTVNGRLSSYTPNNLNQLSQRTVPRAFDVVGKAGAAATVGVTAGGTTYPAARLDEFFFKEIAVGTGAVRVPYTVTATDSTGSSTRTGGKFLPASPEVFTYDFSGNLASDGRFTYTWDAENRLKTMETLASLPSGTNEAKRKLEFAYDSMGRRILKKVWTNPTGSAWVLQAETKFLHELGSWNIQAEFTTTGQFLRTYVWGTDLSGTHDGAGGVGGLLFTSFAPDNSSHAHGMDLNGNVTLLVNTASGNMSGAYDYGPFGEILRQSGDYATLSPYRFSTKYTDDESGFLDYGYRYYNPTVGRWISRDPIEESGGLNLYGMVGNDLVGRIDLLGMAWNSAKGIEALKAAIEVSKGNALPTNSPCCSGAGNLNMNTCTGMDCVTFTTAVITCGYRLSNDSASANKIAAAFKRVGGDGEALAKVLISQFGWKPVYYDRDIYQHKHKYSREGGQPSPSSIYGEDLDYAAMQIAKSKSIHGISPVGAVTGFAPWNATGIGLNAIVRGLQAQVEPAYLDLTAVGFAYGVAYGGFHNFLLSSNSVYEGTPALGAAGKTPRVTLGFSQWVRRGAYSDALGFILLPPDTNVTAAMIGNLKSIRGAKIKPFQLVP